MENNIKIGEKIRKLRKQSGLTQEKLADYLGVSFQAVSKWESGAASPDISFLVPIARLFGVSIDELFDNAPSQARERYEGLQKAINEAWQARNMREYYAAAQKAASEYPGDLCFLNTLASAEWNYAIYEKGIAAEAQNALFEASAKHAADVAEGTKDEKMKRSACGTAFWALFALGRKDEALKYAEMAGDDELIIKCLDGEEKAARKQKLIMDKLYGLIRNLSLPPYNIESLDAADKIIKAAFPDGNYLYFCFPLMQNEMRRAEYFAAEGNFVQALASLKASYSYAVEWDKMMRAGKSAKYTAAIFDKLEFKAKEQAKISLCEQFREYLQGKSFDGMRETEEFRELCGGAAE